MVTSAARVIQSAILEQMDQSTSVVRGSASIPTRTRILDAAMATFATKGYDGSSMQEIANAIGISKPAIYKHFSTKESLLIEVLEIGHTRSTALMQEVSELDVAPTERLRQYLRRHVIWYLNNLDLFHVGVRGWTSLSPEAMANELPRRRGYQQFLRDLIVSCQDAGEADPAIDAKFAAAYLRGSVNSAQDWYRPDGRDSIESIAESMADLAVRMLGNSQASTEWVDDTEPSETEREPADKFAELIEVTLKAFSEKGYAATSIQDIAEEIGILKGSLYHYIDSKYDLLIHIFEAAHVQLNAVIESVARMEGGPEQRLRAIFERQTQWLLRNPAQSSVLFHEWKYLADADRARVTRRRKVLESVIREYMAKAQEVGAVARDLDATRALRFVMGAIYSSMEWYRPDGTDRPSKVAAAYAEFTTAVMRP